MSAAKFLICALFFVYLVQCQRQFVVTIENLSAGAIVPTSFSDIVWALHQGGNPLFSPGQLATTGLQSLAEDGYGNYLMTQASNGTNTTDPSEVVGVVKGPIPVGSTVQFGITASPGQRFSFVTMYTQSNDEFYAPSSGGVDLFSSTNLPLSGTYEVDLYDAGTEINEAPGQGINQPGSQPQSGVGQPVSVPISRVQIAGTNFSASSAVIRFTITAATIFRARVDNIGNGTGFSPIVWATAIQPNVIFTAGQKASPGVQNIAENGNPSTLAAEVAAKSGVLFSGVAGTAPITPGSFVEWNVPAVISTRFFLATMYGWSNDRFFGTPDSGVSLFTNSGPYSSNSANFISIWDAGTAMDEQPGQGLHQAAARHGVPRDPTVWPDEANVVKDAILGDPDGFVYQTVNSTFKLSIFPITDASGFLASNPNQNVYVQFNFAKMFKFSS